jgi:hypothetical protein
MAAAENRRRGCGREATVDGREVTDEPQIRPSRQRVSRAHGERGKHLPEEYVDGKQPCQSDRPSPAHTQHDSFCLHFKLILISFIG